MRAIFIFITFLLTGICQGQDVGSMDLNADFEQKLNGLRVLGNRCGGPTVVMRIHPLLVKSAQQYAQQIYESQRFGHIDAMGESVGDRVDKVGYPWLKVGENLGRGQSSIDQLLEEWQESPSHCRLLMNPDLHELGLGHYGNIWVLHVGSRRLEDP